MYVRTVRSQVPAVPAPQEDWIYNEHQGRNELAGATIGVSLSGGGYRATLFAAGAVAALADGQVWDQVKWVASVSGGSFVNAAAGLELPDAPAAPAVDRFLRIVAERVARRLWPIALPQRTSRIRGLALVARSYDAGIRRHWVGAAGGAVPLANLQHPGRTHAFLAVDLATLSPVVLSDRLVYSPGLRDEPIALAPGGLRLATAIRSSASFPGLPSTRVRSEDLGTVYHPLYDDLHLGDGGVWNNLGTEWERLLGEVGRVDLEDVAAFARPVEFHVVVDASAPAKRPKAWRTRRWPTTLDWPFLSLDRALHAAFQSTLENSRRALRDGSGKIPRRILHVSLDEIPRNQQVLSALVGGAEPEEWAAVADQNGRVGTAGPTIWGIRGLPAVHLMAHGYAQTAACLTARGVPLQHFEIPHERMYRAIT